MQNLHSWVRNVFENNSGWLLLSIQLFWPFDRAQGSWEVLTINTAYAPRKPTVHIAVLNELNIYIGWRAQEFVFWILDNCAAAQSPPKALDALREILPRAHTKHCVAQQCTELVDEFQSTKQHLNEQKIGHNSNCIVQFVEYSSSEPKFSLEILIVALWDLAEVISLEYFVCCLKIAWIICNVSKLRARWQERGAIYIWNNYCF